MLQWAREVQRTLVDEWGKKESPWKIRDSWDIQYEMIGSWKRVVSFSISDWRGMVGETPIALVFKLQGHFHSTGMRASLTLVPEHQPPDTPLSPQLADAIIEATQEIDDYYIEIEGKTPGAMAKKLGKTAARTIRKVFALPSMQKLVEAYQSSSSSGD